MIQLKKTKVVLITFISLILSSTHKRQVLYALLLYFSMVLTHFFNVHDKVNVAIKKKERVNRYLTVI